MYREQIEAYIDGKKDEMLTDLQTLVRIDSQRGTPEEGMPFGEGPARVLKEASALMEKAGLTVTNYDNYVVTGDFGPGEKALDILAHLDVVPVTKDWTVTQPFEPLIRDGRIYGRGTADDKGPAVAALYAIRAVRELGLPIKHSVRLILGSDEECGSSDLEYYYTKEKEAPYSFTPDADFPLINLEKARLAKSFSAELDKTAERPAVILLEGGDKVNVVPAKARAVAAGLDIAAGAEAAARIQEKTGVAFTLTETEDGNLEIRTKGTAAHGSTPELGSNALTALLEMLCTLPLADCKGTKIIHALAGLFPHGDTRGEAFGVAMKDDKSGALSMNLGILKMDTDRIYGEYDVRAPLCASDENLTEVVRTALKAAGLTMEEGNMKPAHYVPEDSFFVKTLLDTYEEYFGKKGKPLFTGGGTYVHELERGVAFGCMTEEVDNHMHGDDEFMEIDMLLRSAKIFADAIVRLCS